MDGMECPGRSGFWQQGPERPNTDVYQRGSLLEKKATLFQAGGVGTSGDSNQGHLTNGFVNGLHCADSDGLL